MMFQYFVKVVPTVYMKVDGEVSLQELRYQSPFNLGSGVLLLSLCDG